MNKHIKIIQNILKKKNRYDLALKIENCYFEDYQVNNNIGEIKAVKVIMRNDPFYLSQKLIWKASLGVSSVDGNFDRIISKKKLNYLIKDLNCS